MPNPDEFLPVADHSPDNSWIEARERAHAALKETWKEDQGPVYHFQVSFRGGMRTMGEALIALSGFTVSEADYFNDGDWQQVLRFACKWSTWQSILKAFESVSSAKMQTSVLRPPIYEDGNQ